jgi:hypothetical protein
MIDEAALTRSEKTINDRHATSRPPGCGMGEVYLDQDKIPGPRVAIKVLRKQYAGDEELVARFRQEAHSAAVVRRPNVVPFHDLGRSQDGSRYIAMEYVPGGHAQATPRRGRPGGGGGTYDDHPVGVWHGAGAGKRANFNQDRAA